MYPYPLTPLETSKRHLSQDDVNGVCDVYPIAAPPPACHQEVDGGCEFSRGPASGFSLLVALSLLLWLRKRA
jgi:hypothetical protein